MSKRRLKILKDEKTEHKEDKKEEHKHEKHDESKKEKVCIFSGKHIPYLIVISCIFLCIGLLIGFFVFSQTSISGDQLIFISPPGCQTCAQMEPIAREVAKTLNIPFVKTGFAQQISNPGFILVYKNISTIAGVGDEYTFKMQICLITNNTQICEEAKKLTPAEEEEEVQPVANAPKSDRPEAHVFIMSYCPYGLQFIKAYVQVMELLGNKADLYVNFVPYIMHGEKEMIENTRMYCIQKEQKDKFTKYLRCFVKDGNAERCISEVGIDSVKLNVCMNATDEQYQLSKTFAESSDRFPPYPIDQALADVYGARGSPTFGINGKQISVTRSAEVIKQAICNAFNNPPSECNQKLSAKAESPGFGEIGAGSGSSGGSQCG
ncbi:MAG: hypothetical protein QW051_03280 [Candidatus Aenigmatarchaeota archaeon]